MLTLQSIMSRPGQRGMALYDRRASGSGCGSLLAANPHKAFYIKNGDIIRIQTFTTKTEFNALEDFANADGAGNGYGYGIGTGRNMTEESRDFTRKLSKHMPRWSSFVVIPYEISIEEAHR